MKNSFFLLLFAVYCSTVQAQINDGLIAYLSFESCDFTDFAGNSSGLKIGDPTCENCGVQGRAMQFNGFGDQAIIIGGVSNLFTTKDFSLSFYFKPVGQGGTQSLITYRDSCNFENAFGITYTPSSGIVDVLLSENTNKNTSVQGQIDFESCWQHVVFIRRGVASILYINGEQVAIANASSRIDLSSNADVRLAGGACIDITDVLFEGLLDEIRFYNKALKDFEVQNLYFAPDKIANSKDTLIYLGNSVEINTHNTCPVYRFDWSPAEDIDDPMVNNAIITPSTHGTHLYTFGVIDDTYNCISYDSIKIRVVDPDSLDCSKIFIPKAFTPDGKGPLKNNYFGISNPYAVNELISLEVFDRWGNRVFNTNDVFETWDGRFKSKELNPGVFLWRMRYKCKGEERIEVGSLTLLK